MFNCAYKSTSVKMKLFDIVRGFATYRFTHQSETGQIGRGHVKSRVRDAFFPPSLRPLSCSTSLLILARSFLFCPFSLGLRLQDGIRNELDTFTRSTNSLSFLPSESICQALLLHPLSHLALMLYI